MCGSMHGTLPISEEQALAAMRARPPARVSIAALAREWGWPHDKVSTRLKRWRRSGELASPAKRRQQGDMVPTLEALPAPATAEPVVAVPTLEALPAPATAEAAA